MSQQPSQQLDQQQRAWVESAVPGVAALARAMGASTGFASSEELESAGYEALVKAAFRYDPHSGVPFAAYAHYRARGAMLDALRRVAPSLRHRARAVQALEATQSLLERAQKRLPDANTAETRTLAQRVEAAAELVAQTTAAVLLSKKRPVDPDHLESAQGSVEHRFLHQESLARLRTVVEDLPDEDRALIEAIYEQGLSMADYAAQIGRNKSSVSRAHAKLLSRISKRLTDWGPGARGPDP